MSPTDPAELEKLKALAETVLSSIGPVGSSAVPFMRALSAYQEEARPEVVLALIAEIERLRAQVDELETPKPRHSRGCLCGRCDG